MELPIAVGEVIAHKYRVDRFIGQGGMGVVVAAFYLELEQPVAIKFLLNESGVQGEGAERFRREARAAAKIHSEHVVRVFDFGLFEERVPYMVMELLEGNDLEQEIEERGALPIEEAASFVLQAIDAVAEAHAVGIVHRDLKPTNLFLSRRSDGSRIVKVLDFGISKSLGGTRPREVALTRTAAFVGSPLYMSPEQMRSARDVDARTDIWALGAILYVALTGQLPHPGTTLPEVCVAVMNSAPRPLRDFLPEAPAGLEEVLMRCLAKERDSRYSSVAQLAEQLLPFAPECQPIVERAARLLGGVQHPVSPRRSLPSSLTPVGVPSTQRLSTGPQPLSFRSKRRGRVLLGAGLGLAAALGLWLMRPKDVPAPTASSTPMRAPGSSAAVEAPPALTDVHAAIPVEQSTSTAEASASAPVPPAPVAALSTVSSAAAPRKAPRVQTQSASRPYTYFGGRR